MAFGLVDGVSFTAQSIGTGTFVFGASRPSFLTLAQANANGVLADGQTVSYLAQDSLIAPTQREWGHGIYSLAGNSIARTTVLGGTSGPGTLVSFGVVPVVSLTALAEDLSRIKLTANKSFFVNGSTGSDSNTGFSSGAAWATLQHADDVIAQTYDLNGFTATINIANGTYLGIVNGTGYYNGGGGTIGQVNYLGSATPTNVIINDSAGHQGCWSQYAPNVGSVIVDFSGVALAATNNCQLYVDNFYVGAANSGKVTFATAQPVQVSACIANFSLFSGNTVLQGTCTLAANLAGWSGQTPVAFQDDGSDPRAEGGMGLGSTLTINGNPSFENALILISHPYAVWDRFGTISGAYTGPGFSLDTDQATLRVGGADWWSGFGSPSVAQPGLGVDCIIFGNNGHLHSVGGSQVIGSITNFSTPTTGFNMTLGNYDGIVILDPAGTLATGTITMPANPLNEMRINIRSSQTITALTISPNTGQSVKGNPTTLAAGGLIDAVYKSSNTTWYF